MSWGPRPGRRTGAVAAGPVGSAGACVGASRNDQATPRTLRRWGSRVKPENTRCSGTCGGRVATSGGLGRFACFHAQPTLGARLSTLGAHLSTSCVTVVHAIGGVVHRVRTGRPRVVHGPRRRRRYRTPVLSGRASVASGRRPSAPPPVLPECPPGERKGRSGLESGRVRHRGSQRQARRERAAAGAARAAGPFPSIPLGRPAVAFRGWASRQIHRGPAASRASAAART